MTEEQNKLAEEEPEAMKWFRKGRESVLRKNQSGCCCLFNEDDEIVSVCAAHEEWAADREPATEAVLAQGDKLMQAKLSGFNEGLEEAARAIESLPTTDIAIFASNEWNAVKLTKYLADKVLRTLKGKGASQGECIGLTDNHMMP